MVVKGWIWKPLVAGLSGTVVHFLFHVSKIACRHTPVIPAISKLSTFSLSQWVGTNVPAIVPWALSFANGMAILGFLFGRIHRMLPGRKGAAKGIIFGLIGWVLMGLIFFPLIGLGPFAIRAGLGAAPAMLSLGMLLTYSVVLGTVYFALDAWNPTFSR
jgi:hypothetical protein